MGSGADMKKADEIQIGGQHYKVANPAQEHWNLAIDLGWNYLQACAIKYLMRYSMKNGVQDLEKAKHYIDKMIEVEKAKLGQAPKNMASTV